ncbi:hypothetical protein DEA8626_02769 [Defluviimonas aquaemixtae]|uniref:Uncharacterized protein n=1 Tax=Albidovulum aquaemixtae TaxID=1542388 RepID=A0A2R8BK71_9RHOB|nr:hypothetical protein [Defluviimonas aquaemixtae]SPH23703.1 hypothetical protein DEA8626_02769 [Defluviimonas aquaemixtae]
MILEPRHRGAAASGILNPALEPFGVMPMRHGAGRIAAPLMMTTLCVGAALMEPKIAGLLSVISLPVVGALLGYAAGDLIFMRRMFDARPDCRPVIGVKMAATVLFGALAGLVASLAVEYLRACFARRGQPGAAAKM